MNFKALSQSIFDRNDFSESLYTAKYFRSFQDRPWNIWTFYELLDKNFPDSFFILTERDPDSWWRSVEKWLTVSNKDDQDKYLRYLKHLKVSSFDKKEFVDAYLNYNYKAKEYFKDKDNFLIMNLEQGDEWEKLCNFLHIPIPGADFPHANKQ
jgi:hypothetical protein